MQTARTLSADWTQVLAHIEASLTEAVAKLHEREQALTAFAPSSQTPKLPDFAKFDERLTAFVNRPRQADQQLVQTDAALRDGEDALRQWLSRAEATRRQLAAWVGRAVI